MGPRQGTWRYLAPRLADSQLLDLPSHDLDVALSNPSGFAFAEAFVAFLHTRGVETGNVGKVAANPEQSKHLETGTTRVMGLECDFVGLRSETYTDSRIPDQVVSPFLSFLSYLRSGSS